MRKKGILKILLVLVISALLAYIAYFGFNVQNKQLIDTNTGINNMRMGLDIKGGVRLVYSPEGVQATTEDLKKAVRVIRKRLDSRGLNEATATVDELNTSNQMIVVEIPGEDDPQKASEYIGKTAKLQFVTEDGQLVMEGNDIVSAKHAYEQTSDIGGYGHVVNLTITSDAQQRFYEATANNIGRTIMIMLDDEVVSAPVVNTAINSTTAVITMGQGASAQEAQELADLISSGALPFTLKQVNQEFIGPSIGHSAFDITLKAGVLAFVLIILFMIFVYRLPGFVSAVSLSTYTIILIILHQVFNITITLPGIAGIILSIAMAVDANVMIYERLKEELKAGKTLKTSIDLGFNKAFTAIRDSNITTIISAIILGAFGTGPIKGFAFALGMGVFLSLATSIWLTKFLLVQVMNVADTKNHWLYGA